MEREEHGFICAISAGATSYFNDLYFLIGLACLPDNISQESELTAEAELLSHECKCRGKGWVHLFSIWWVQSEVRPFLDTL